MGSSSSALPPLPVVDGAAAGDADETGGAPRPLRLFLVEDSPAVRERLVDFLVEAGRIEFVGFAETEADAVRQLNGLDVDVAIVDLNLREGTGIGVIEAVRATQPAPPPTIVVLTNYAFPEFANACRQRGADYFFDKSTQFGAVKSLLDAIRRA